MKVDAFKCDVCQKVKGEVNHWFLYRVDTEDRHFILFPWADHYAQMEHNSHLCGVECVQKMMSQTIESWRQS